MIGNVQIREVECDRLHKVKIAVRNRVRGSMHGSSHHHY